MSNTPGAVEALFAGQVVVPVVVIDDALSAEPLGEALVRGGIACAEITLRTPAGLGAIRSMAENPAILVGAGTVLNAKQAEQAVGAGAKFMVSPGYDRGVLQVGAETGVPVVPGVATATEAQRAVNDGVTVVKFFPAETAGGLAAVKALSAPFAGLRFMPTGGITLQTAQSWLDFSPVMAVGGSWIAQQGLVAEGRFDVVEQNARRTVAELASTDRSVSR